MMSYKCKVGSQEEKALYYATLAGCRVKKQSQEAKKYHLSFLLQPHSLPVQLWLKPGLRFTAGSDTCGSRCPHSFSFNCMCVDSSGRSAELGIQQDGVSRVV